MVILFSLEGWLSDIINIPDHKAKGNSPKMSFGSSSPEKA
jgi:hypothetical protein